MTKVGYRNIQLDPATRTVRFDRAGRGNGPRRNRKGYAVDRMVEVLRKNGIEIALVTGVGQQYLWHGRSSGRAGLDRIHPRSAR